MVCQTIPAYDMVQLECAKGHSYIRSGGGEALLMVMGHFGQKAFMCSNQGLFQLKGQSVLGGDHFRRMSGIKPRNVMIPLAEGLGHCREAGK